MVNIEPLQAHHKELLPHFMYLALFVRPGNPPFQKSKIYEPDFRIYFEDWGSRSQDHGFILTDNLKVSGAVWMRCFTESEPSHAYVSDNIPELTIAIEQALRGKGHGTALLNTINEYAQSLLFPGISLSVDKLNPALSLYLRLGFEYFSEQETTFTLLKVFDKQAIPVAGKKT